MKKFIPLCLTLFIGLSCNQLDIIEQDIVSDRQVGALISFDSDSVSKPISFLYNENLKLDSHILYASISKVFLTTSFLKLEERGVVSLTDKLSKYFPAIKAENDCDLKTIMTHHCRLKPSEYPVKDLSEKDINELFIKAPRHKFNYSNIGYIILNQILNKLKADPLEVVKLSNFRILRGKACFNQKLISSYEFDQGIYYRKVENYTVLRYGAAGNYCGTPKALIEWTQSLFQGKIISKNAMERLLDSSEGIFGLGLFLSEANSDIINFRGDMDGFMLQLSFHKKKNKGVLFVANTTTKYHFRSYKKIENYLLKNPKSNQVIMRRTIDPVLGSKLKDTANDLKLEIIKVDKKVITVKFKEKNFNLLKVDDVYYNYYEDMAVSFYKGGAIVYKFGYKKEFIN